MRTNVIFNMQEDTCSLTNVGKVRKQNEDNLGYAETPNGDVFVVCDGMGGHVGGRVASSIAVDAIMEYFGSEKKLYITEAMEEAIRYANRKIYEKAEEEPELKGMGTTIVLTVFQEDKAYIAHVGDSRIYLFSNEKLYRITKDHSHVQQLVDIGAITPKEAETHPKKNIILKALGINEDVEPEVQKDPLLLKNGDILLMCSDGLSDMVNDNKIEATLQQTDNVKKAGEELMQLALDAGGKDNITLQLIKISKSNYKESVFIDKSNKQLEPEKPDNSDNTPVDIDVTNEKVDEKSSFLKRILSNKLFWGVIGIIVMGTLGWYAVSFFKESKDTNEIKNDIRVFALKDDYSKFNEIKNDSLDINGFIKEFAGRNKYMFDSVQYNLITTFIKDSLIKIRQKDDSVIVVFKINNSNEPKILTFSTDKDSIETYLRSSIEKINGLFVIHEGKQDKTLLEIKKETKEKEPQKQAEEEKDIKNKDPEN